MSPHENTYSNETIIRTNQGIDSLLHAAFMLQPMHYDYFFGPLLKKGGSYVAKYKHCDYFFFAYRNNQIFIIVGKCWNEMIYGTIGACAKSLGDEERDSWGCDDMLDCMRISNGPPKARSISSGSPLPPPPTLSRFHPALLWPWF
jgi:hypothetical protein